MLFAHHGSYTLMDRFVMMEKGLVLFLFLQMVLFLNSQTNWKEKRTNNQVKYEALLFGFKFLESMSVKHVEAYGD